MLENVGVDFRCQIVVLHAARRRRAGFWQLQRCYIPTNSCSTHVALHVSTSSYQYMHFPEEVRRLSRFFLSMASVILWLEKIVWGTAWNIRHFVSFEFEVLQKKSPEGDRS